MDDAGPALTNALRSNGLVSTRVLRVKSALKGERAFPVLVRRPTSPGTLQAVSSEPVALGELSVAPGADGRARFLKVV